MGIYDRDYVRREGPSFLGSLVERGTITKWLVGINVACFIVQMLTLERVAGRGYSLPGPFTEALWMDADAVLRGEVWRLLSYAFLHSQDIWHIVFNMLILWWFGQQVEEARGPREFLAFYLAAAVASGLAFVGAHQLGLNGPLAVGASGAVTATLVLCACYNPRQVILLFFILPVPIWAVVVLNVLVDSFGLLGGGGRVAFSAHLGGAAFGFLYYSLGWRLLGPWFRLPSWPRSRAKPRLRLYHEDEPSTVSVGVTTAPKEDDQLEVEMDAILAKIPRVGVAGLTEREKEILRKASEMLKRRRR